MTGTTFGIYGITYLALQCSKGSVKMDKWRGKFDPEPCFGYNQVI